MVTRTFNADFINSVANHPAVKDGAEVKGLADLSEVAANPSNFILVNEFGGFVVIKKLPGLYECHTLFLPEGRGQIAVDAVNEALNFMFLKTDCMRIVTKVNMNNKPVRMFAGQFFRRRGFMGDHYYYSLDVEDWIEKSDACFTAGREFHNSIEPEHGEDSSHDAYAGAAILMAQHRNLYKGQAIYNKWSVMSGYEPVMVLAENPAVIRCGNMVLSVDEGVTVCQ